METFTEDTFEFWEARIVGDDKGAGVGVMGELRGPDDMGNFLTLLKNLISCRLYFI